MPSTSPSYSFTIRLKATNKPGMVGLVTSTIGEMGGDIGAVDIVSAEKNGVIRDYTLNSNGVKHAERIGAALAELDGVEVKHISDRTFLMHLGGKISIENKVPLNTRADLSMAYTPGVARICEEIAKNKENAYKLTIKRNTIAIVTDGSAVLGLGNLGPEAALPVMEGKAMLFKSFGNVNAFPICLNTNDPQEIIETVERISPVFGGINLEDISSPRCFEIERALTRSLDIPVFHDDQHGTSVVMLAGVINALKVIGRNIKDVKIVICGMGAAGIACTKLLACAGAGNILGLDSTGIVSRGRIKELNKEKQSILDITNPNNVDGTLGDAMKGANIFIGVSSPDVLTLDMVKTMDKDSVIFALSNPDPEISPDIAAPHVRIMATGRSDYPNQINNVLCFPGLFRGLLDSSARLINDEMQLAASRAIATTIADDQLSEDYIIPSVFDERVAKRVAKAVIKVATETQAARRTPKKRQSLNPR
ncbi:NADP-dependent malic enzyme [hydrothermal vent metagenome]|uniref:NADP-dependent malic enzyme n=1 Tax=hydrothermal vent metagenome TaxID=652676 RepID=A0A3B0VCR4_9ZZZZ